MKEITGILQQMIDAVKSVAPSVWAIYVRQVVFEGHAMAAVAMLLMAISGVSLHEGWKLTGQRTDEGDDKGFPLLILGLPAAIVCLITIVMAFLRINNPEYYAIQKLLPGGGCR